jgi:hypothetical protein
MMAIMAVFRVPVVSLPILSIAFPPPIKGMGHYKTDKFIYFVVL